MCFRHFEPSLATLRECTIERGEEGAHHQAAGTSACAHSVISAIPSQEIQRMVQEVKALNEETLKVKNLLYFYFNGITQFHQFSGQVRKL